MPGVLRRQPVRGQYSVVAAVVILSQNITYQLSELLSAAVGS